MSPEHYAAYDAATIAIQRQTERDVARQIGLLRSNISVAASARDRPRWRHRVEHACQHHVRAEHRQLALRYHPSRNFDKLFEGDGQMPIDKDAIAQFIGWMGELTMVNPLFNWRFYDSNPCGLIGVAGNAGPAFPVLHRTAAAFTDPQTENCNNGYQRPRRGAGAAVQASRRQERSQVAKEGRPIFEDVEMCEIRKSPGIA
jgi:hypothetical protein